MENWCVPLHVHEHQNRTRTYLIMLPSTCLMYHAYLLHCTSCLPQDRFSVARVICGASLTSDDVLVDVGSGLGKLATLAVTLTNAKEAWGLELSTSRHAAAIEGADEMTRAGLLEEEERGRLRFWQGDCGEGGVALPPQVLGATAFLLTLKDGRASVHSLLARLAACQTHTGEDRVLWSVAHPLPLQGGLQYKNTFQVPGYSKVHSRMRKIMCARLHACVQVNIHTCTTTRYAHTRTHTHAGFRRPPERARFETRVTCTQHARVAPNKRFSAIRISSSERIGFGVVTARRLRCGPI